MYKWATSYNSGHTATVLRTSAKIRQSRTSYVRKPLSEIVAEGLQLEKNWFKAIQKMEGDSNGY